MIDFSWSEIAVVILVAVMVLGPKELPKAMRTMAQFMRKARKMAGEFQGHINEIVRESELDEVKNAVTRVTTTNVGSEVEKLIDPSGEFKRELDETISSTRNEIESAARLDSPAATTLPAPPAASPATVAPSPQVGAPV
jgi:sec-independent protein translocase protein TatB